MFLTNVHMRQVIMNKGKESGIKSVEEKITK